MQSISSIPGLGLDDDDDEKEGQGPSPSVPAVERHLFEARTWAKHPYAVLHELAHAYHDQVLSFDNPEVIKVFDAAMILAIGMA